ncbi:TrmH family RNA methyltransferase [Actinomyces minihominis]|uniref:TrmH family RNA methyltransferase n=1 Tax=Actinomyces minihominis TaxID=2002838 RepID=UPI000C08BBA9|nr:RNA methyltransferase [Actinomyces minihominis]
MDFHNFIDNPRSDRIRTVAGLRGSSGRRRSGRILVEGPQAVRELVNHRPDFVVDVYLTDEVEERDRELAAASRRATHYVHNVTPEVARAISPDCQGVAAVATVDALEADAGETWEVLRARASQASQSAGARSPFVVCLPETQDPGNAGTIIRSADAMGAAAVILGSGTVDPANPKVIRSSAGSVFHIPILRLPLETVRANLPEGEWPILGTSGHDSDVTLDALAVAALTGETEEGVGAALANPHVWVFGNEARGLSEGAVAICDLLVEIPLLGDAESLNAAAAAAMCLYTSHLSTTRL